MYQIGIDMGGTFTDFIVVGEGNVQIIKIPSDKEEPIHTVINGLEEIAKTVQLTVEEFLPKVNRLVHGNTVAINALLQRRGVKTALIATDGFQDTLEMRRSRLQNQWDFFAPIPPVLVPRYLRYSLKERVDYSGKVIEDLDLKILHDIVDKLQVEKVESVAISLLFSFVNPSHEKFVKAYIEEKLPKVFVTISSEVAPKLGEYERTSTTVLNAYLTPLVSSYLNELSSMLEGKGLKSKVQLVQNNGGLADISLAKEFGVKGLFSGPAAGSSGAKALGLKLSQPNLILVDMGGTSFDVSLVIDHSIKVMPEAEVEGYPVNLPLVDINSVGIGGGSIAFVDEGGRFCVGPDSAEAYPGPACYNRGGQEPTITDAALLLGFINEDRFGGGKMEVKKELAIGSIQEKAATPLKIGVTEAAYGIYQIAVAKMVDAVHLMTVQKGYDPREFVLCAVGGASSIFATSIAQELGIKTIVIPAYGEVFCAQGMLESHLKLDIVQSIVEELSCGKVEKINSVLKQLKSEARKQLCAQGVLYDNSGFKFTFEIRYSDQHHQLSVPLTGDVINEKTLNILLEEFHSLHKKNYGYFEENQECSLINIRLEAWEKELLDPPLIDQRSTGVQTSLPAQYREICWEKNLIFHQVPVYQSTNLQIGETILGPALIEKTYTTIFVSPSFTAFLDNSSNIILAAKGADHK